MPENFPHVKLTRTSPEVLAKGSPHVYLTCEDHPDLYWSCKNIALSEDAEGNMRYNGSRSIFFCHHLTPGRDECPCHHSKLVGIERTSAYQRGVEES